MLLPDDVGPALFSQDVFLIDFPADERRTLAFWKERRIFEQQLGVSPLQYLQTRRLLTAKQLLADTDLPITEVALASGFASVRRFNAAFIEHYGLNPTQLRREGADKGGGGLAIRAAREAGVRVVAVGTPAHIALEADAARAGARVGPASTLRASGRRRPSGSPAWPTGRGPGDQAPPR